MLAAFAPAFAQEKSKDPKTMRKEILEFKMKFLAQEMDLREDQQKRFFDLYTQMSNEKAKLFRETRQLEKKIDNNASEAEYEAVSRAITAAKEKDAEIDRRYDAKFSEFLTSKQLFKMKSAEKKFRQKMHEMRHKKKRR